MRDILWNEIRDAKFDEEYACLMMSLKSRQLYNYNIFMAIFSTTGIFSWGFWKWIPSITCGIIAVLSIIKLTEQYIIPSEKQIEAYNTITSFYNKLFLNLQKIWFESERELITEEEAFSQLQTLQHSKSEINTSINNIHKKVNKNIQAEAKKIADNYFKQVYKV